MKLVLISDTHNRLDSISIPDGDILIHAGDHTGRGHAGECKTALKKLGQLKSRFKHVVAIAGNHDFLAEKEPHIWWEFCEQSGVTYLQDYETTLEGIRIYGTPWQPWFHNWAFNLNTAAERKAKWDRIPSGLDVLITHGPPNGYGDMLDDNGSNPGAHVGCRELLDAIDRTQPKLHVFGHIHEGHGTYKRGDSTLVNASSCDSHYRPVNPPIVFTLK